MNRIQNCSLYTYILSKMGKDNCMWVIYTRSIERFSMVSNIDFLLRTPERLI